MASHKKIAEVTKKVRARFRSFGGGNSGDLNAVAIALKDARPQFAGGVDIEEVVRFIADELHR